MLALAILIAGKIMACLSWCACQYYCRRREDKACRENVATLRLAEQRQANRIWAQTRGCYPHTVPSVVVTDVPSTTECSPMNNATVNSQHATVHKPSSLKQQYRECDKLTCGWSNTCILNKQDYLMKWRSCGWANCRDRNLQRLKMKSNIRRRVCSISNRCVLLFARYAECFCQTGLTLFFSPLLISHRVVLIRLSSVFFVRSWDIQTNSQWCD
jgi:hypothetical protein